MGLKIENVNETGLRGVLDDLPFTLEVSGNSWTAALGDAQTPVWHGRAEIAPKGERLRHSLSDIRQMAYWALSVYRNATRGITAAA